MKLNKLAPLGLALTLTPVGLAMADGYGQPAAEPQQEVAPMPQATDSIWFDMERPQAIKDTPCAPYAKAEVVVESKGTVDVMTVAISGLPPETLFDFFVTQVPNFPFGMSWYQGEMLTDMDGEAEATFIGRFNIETFFVAPGVATAPQVDDLDAAENPDMAPIHTFHLGLWFDSPEDAAAAGCPDIETPFNGEHNAGIQVLNTGGFPDDAGPLSQLQ